MLIIKDTQNIVPVTIYGILILKQGIWREWIFHRVLCIVLSLHGHRKRPVSEQPSSISRLEYTIL
jgi:hypothetical protein